MADRILAVVGRVVEIPQQGGDRALIVGGAGHTVHVLEIDHRPAGIDIEIHRQGIGHDGPGYALVIVGIAFAPGQTQAVQAGIETGQGVRAAGILVAAELVVGEMTPFMDDHGVIPFIGARRVIGKGYCRPAARVERARASGATLPVDSEPLVEEWRVGGVVVPESPGPVNGVGDVEYGSLGLAQFVEAHVEIDVPAFRFDHVGIPAVEVLVFDGFDAGDQVRTFAHLGADAEVEFELVVERAIVVTEAKGEFAVGIGNGVAVGVVGHRIFLAHLHQDVMDGHLLAGLVQIVPNVRWHGRRRRAAGCQNGSRHTVLPRQEAADAETTVGGTARLSGQMRLVDHRPVFGRAVHRRARVQIGGRGRARAGREEEHAVGGQ